MESDQRQGRFIDPAAGKTTLADWSQDWLGALDVAIRTEDFYRSLLRRHILPRWGEHGLADISGIKAAAWAKQLRDQGYSPVTVTSVMKLLSLLLSDAVDERLIPVNPIRCAAPRTTTQRPPGRTPVGHPLAGARGRRQHRPAAHRRGGRRAACRHRSLDRGPMGRDRRPAAGRTTQTT